jgi:hypothetical protein
MTTMSPGRAFKVKVCKRKCGQKSTTEVPQDALIGQHISSFNPKRPLKPGRNITHKLSNSKGLPRTSQATSQSRCYIGLSTGTDSRISCACRQQPTGGTFVRKVLCTTCYAPRPVDNSACTTNLGTSNGVSSNACQLVGEIKAVLLNRGLEQYPVIADDNKCAIPNIDRRQGLYQEGNRASTSSHLSQSCVHLWSTTNTVLAPGQVQHACVCTARTCCKCNK